MLRWRQNIGGVDLDYKSDSVDLLSVNNKHLRKLQGTGRLFTIFHGHPLKLSERDHNE